MCGIAGYFNNKSHSPNNSQILEKLNFAIKHRGPDDEGYTLFTDSKPHKFYGKDTPKEVIEQLSLDNSIVNYLNSVGGLAHRRLSILDLSPNSHQPFADNSNRFHLVFNGEIYNYLEIREELKSLGHVFQTNGDTEVLMNAFIQWGKDCLLKFNGMFAFVIYDNEQKQLFGARDALGVKPLYILHKNETIAFSSEQQSLHHCPEFDSEFNNQYLFDYFVFGEHERRRHSIFKDIIELKGGEYFTYSFDTNQLNIESYCELNNRDIQFSEEELRSKVLSSIKLRLRSDVEVGTCLSGGLDSSIIAGSMREHLGKHKNIHSFTSHYPGFEYDEKKYADAVIDHNNLTGHFVSPHIVEFEEDFDEFIQSLDLPIWSTSTYAQWRVLKLANRQNIKVVLDGQGADELFAGYNPHYMSYWRDLIKSMKYGILFNEMKSTYGLGKSIQYYLKEWMRHYGVRSLPKSLAIYMHQKAYDDLKFLKIDFYKNELDEAYDHFRARLNTNGFNGFLKSELINGRLKTYLRCEDRCSMWHGVESRTPFADDLDLIEYGFNIPANQKIVQGSKKHILKNSMKDFLPKSVYERMDKIGFQTPHNEWMKKIAKSKIENFDSNLDFVLNTKHIKNNQKQLFQLNHNTETGREFKYLAFSQWVKNYCSS